MFYSLLFPYANDLSVGIFCGFVMLVAISSQNALAVAAPVYVSCVRVCHELMIFFSQDHRRDNVYICSSRSHILINCTNAASLSAVG